MSLFWEQMTQVTSTAANLSPKKARYHDSCHDVQTTWPYLVTFRDRETGTQGARFPNLLRFLLRLLENDRTSLLKKALSEPCVEQVHLSFGNPPQVIQVQKFVTVFVTIGGR
jgi:hypothetical protein